MKKKEKIFGIILPTADYKGFFNQNKELIFQLSKDFKKIYVLNVINLKYRSKVKNIINSKLFPKNYKCINFSSSKSFLKFFKFRECVALQYLSKNPDFFKIFYLIKLAKIKNIMVMNLGNYGNKQTPDFNINHIFAFRHYYQKGFYYLFRILTILNIFPKIELLFESNTKTISAHNNGLSKKFENLFPFFKISYFRKIIKINSIFFSKNKKNRKDKKKFILYIDVPLDHGDIVTREGVTKMSTKKNFYKNLRFFLKDFSKIFKYKIVIGLHPSSKIGYRYLSDFEISKKRTIDLVDNCEIAICTHSSLISSAVFNHKKILSIKSKYLSNYVTNLSNKYRESLNLFTINIDESFDYSKKYLLKKMRLSFKNYNSYIKTRLNSDGDKDPFKKISKQIKKIYFSNKR